MNIMTHSTNQVPIYPLNFSKDDNETIKSPVNDKLNIDGKNSVKSTKNYPFKLVLSKAGKHIDLANVYSNKDNSNKQMPSNKSCISLSSGLKKGRLFLGYATYV